MVSMFPLVFLLSILSIVSPKCFSPNATLLVQMQRIKGTPRQLARLTPKYPSVLLLHAILPLSLIPKKMKKFLTLHHSHFVSPRGTYQKSSLVPTPIYVGKGAVMFLVSVPNSAADARGDLF